MNENEKFCPLGLGVINTEIRALEALRERIDARFTKACEYMLACDGRIVVTGIGKSGHIGGKIAATLASTGSPAFFMHPGEANHGDFGMILKRDVVIAISNSGDTQEIMTLLPLIKRLGVPLITLTGTPDSPLAHAADANLDVSVNEEACPLGLAPTASTTAALAMGDALAIALLEQRGFTQEDFARSHPGGRLGRRLLVRTADLMHTGNAIPLVRPNTLLDQALIEVTQKSLGLTGIIDTDGRLAGVFTDGDLRRAIDDNLNVHTTAIEDVMTRECKTIQTTTLAAEALNIMETLKITCLFVVDDAQHPIGVLHMHHLLAAGVA